MVSKAIFLFCAQTFFIQCISSQCIGAGYGISEALARPWNPYLTDAPLTATWAAGPCTATPFATAEWATDFPIGASNGGGFPITSASPMSVTGVSVIANNAYEGSLALSGALPFLAAVALEGAVPTTGISGVTYGCGNGNVAILSEDLNNYAGPYDFSGIAAPGYNYGRGCFGASY